MAQRAPTIECQDGEEFTYKWTLKVRGQPKDLTGFAGVIDARDKRAAPGTRIISSQAVLIPTPTNGEVFFTFTQSITGIIESTQLATEIDGEYRLLFTKGTETMKTPRGSFLIHRDPMKAAT